MSPIRETGPPHQLHLKDWRSRRHKITLAIASRCAASCQIRCVTNCSNSPTTNRAFQIDQEPDRVRDRYGRTKLGQRCLLARRLIEAGVRFVTISEPVGWDTTETKQETENTVVGW